jgi:hypothetical protein
MSFILGSLQNESVLCLICHKFSKTQNLRFFDLAQNFKKPRTPRFFHLLRKTQQNPKPEVSTKSKNQPTTWVMNALPKVCQGLLYQRQ